MKKTGTSRVRQATPPPKQTVLGKKLREYRKQLRHFGKRKV